MLCPSVAGLSLVSGAGCSYAPSPAVREGRQPRKMRMTSLSDDEHFPYIVAPKKELDRGVLPEEVFNMPIVEDAL